MSRFTVETLPLKTWPKGTPFSRFVVWDNVEDTNAVVSRPGECRSSYSSAGLAGAVADKLNQCSREVVL